MKRLKIIARRKDLWVALWLALWGALMALTMAAASEGGAFDLSWFTVEGGGDRATGGEYTLTGSIGQVEAGPRSAAGPFVLKGGFWNPHASHRSGVDSQWWLY